MSFSESLTVRILGDSSGLRQELESAMSLFDQFEQRLSSASDGGEKLANSFNRLSSAARPIQQLSNQLNRLNQQLRAISGQSISINVQPAIQSLSQLMAMIQRTAAALRSLSVGPVGGGPIPAPPTNPGNPGGTAAPRQYALGGFVTGPSGIDRVPAQLTAGEYVLNKAAVTTLGLSFVDQLNRSPETVASGDRFAPSLPFDSNLMSRRSGTSALVASSHRPTVNINVPPPVSTTDNNPRRPNRTPLPSHRLTASTRSASERGDLPSPTVNQFGGIEINVRETADVSFLMNDLRKQGITSRHRRG